MLETVIEIGRIFREEGRLAQHRYIKQGYNPESKSEMRYLNIPIDKEMNIRLEEMDEIPENKRSKLFYLNFKTSDNDSLKKYIFGDIYREFIPNLKDPSKNKEDGNYRFGDPNVKAKAFTVSSFQRGIEDSEFFKGTKIEGFRNSFSGKIKEIEKIIKENNSIYLHFDFNKKNWYELEKEFNLINKKLLESFATYKEGVSVFVLDKFLYKTLSNSDVGIPNNSSEFAYKTKNFKTVDEIMDLMYGIDYSTKAILSKGPIKVVALPRSPSLTADSIERFFSKKSLSKHDLATTQVNAESNRRDDDEAIAFFVDNDFDTISTQFDIILSKSSSSASSPDVDMIELSRVNKSFLVDLNDRILRIQREITEKQKELFRDISNIKAPSIFNSFINILGDVTKDKKKYHSHLLKVLPKIYTGNYFRDDILLTSFVDKVQFNIRQDKENYNFLKFDLEFLIKLRNKKEDEMEKIVESKSYQMGVMLGRMAQPLKKKIASFEKAYVGLLSRRISNLNDFRKFANFINEKLNIHTVAYPDLKDCSIRITNQLKAIGDVEYNKDNCAFGFFEGYYTYNKKNEDENNEQELGENNE